MRLRRSLTFLTVVAVAGALVLPAAAQGGSATSPEAGGKDAADAALQASGYGPPPFVLERHDFLAQRFAEFFSRVRPLAGAPGESSGPSGPPDHAGQGGRPDHAGESGPPDHAGRPDGAGPPDHAGQGGPPDHAGEPGPPPHAGRAGPPPHASSQGSSGDD